MTGREIPKRQPWDIVKSKISVQINNLELTEDGDKPKTYKIVNTRDITISGKEFKNSMQLDYVDGIDNRVEIVSEKPTAFKINCVYIRKDGKRAWVYTK